MKQKKTRFLLFVVAIFFLIVINIYEKIVFTRQEVAESNGQSNSQLNSQSNGQPKNTNDWVTSHAEALLISTNTVDFLDPRCWDLKNFDKSVAFLIHTENMINNIPNLQSNVKNEVKAIARLLFLDDWAVLRLRYPKLPKKLGENLYNSVVEFVGKSNNIEVVDWVRSELVGVSLEEVIQSQSAESAVAMNRHYQWIIEDGSRPALMEVLRELGGEFESSTLLGSPMLMDLWGYGFMRAESQDWENQRLETSLPAEFSRTAEERALFSRPSPKQVQAAAEERRWFQSLHQQIFAWRLSHLHGVEDPARILEIVDKIRFTDAHHFGWPDP